ncbi:IclR family transcriptional regulator [Lentzea alba]|uniref:IclR family transcriptional regulator n=1 Tax=Lentzea alba TaxID=2714351 RepID=UPI0039BEDEC3
MAGNTSVPGATVVARTIALLAAFDEAHPRLTLTELSHRADLPLTTAHRLVNELTKAGALTRTSNGYVVGQRLWQLGTLAPVQTDLRRLASPFLHDLYAGTLATVHLGVRDKLKVLYLDRISGQRSVPVVSEIGSHLPLHATGVGKVLLAHAPEALRREALQKLDRVTAYTITQPAQLAKQLDRIIEDGYATTYEEMSLGACSVAVPIRHNESVVASLGVVVPSLKRDKVRLVSALRVAAHGIERSLSSGVTHP